MLSHGKVFYKVSLLYKLFSIYVDVKESTKQKIQNTCLTNLT